jgi:hypothetical protein
VPGSDEKVEGKSRRSPLSVSVAASPCQDRQNRSMSAAGAAAETNTWRRGRGVRGRGRSSMAGSLAQPGKAIGNRSIELLGRSPQGSKSGAGCEAETLGDRV